MVEKQEDHCSLIHYEKTKEEMEKLWSHLIGPKQHFYENETF
jgi:hypothetical protein